MTPNAVTPGTRRSYHIAIFLFTLIGLVLRLANITALDPFVDESGNILVSNDPNYHSVVDSIGQGRPLLQFLFRPAMWFAQVLGPDWFVWSARYQTALVGSATAVLVSLLTLSTLGPQAALLATAIVNTQPLFVIHDRLALQDPYTSFFILAAVVFGTSVVKLPATFSYQRLLMYAGLGLSMGFALTNKITALGPVAWTPCVVWALTRAPARCVVRAFLWSGIFAIPLLLSLAPRPWLLGSNLLGSHHVPWHLPLLAPSISTTSSVLDSLLFLLRGLDFLISTLLNFTSLGYVAVLLAAVVMCARYKGNISWGIGLLLLCSFDTVAFHSIAYSRYFHVDGLFFTLFIVAMFHRYVIQRTPGQERRCPTWLLLVSVMLLATLGGTLNTVHAVRFPTAENVFKGTDYQDYARSKHSGYGVRDFVSGISSHLAQHSKLMTIFTAGPFSPLGNILRVHNLLQPDAKVRVGDIDDEWFPAIALYYSSWTEGEPSTFLVARETQALHNQSTLSASGITCDTLHTTPRLCPNCSLELLKCQIGDAAHIRDTLPLQESPRPDGFVGPRLRVVRPPGKTKVCLTVSFPDELQESPPKLAVRTTTAIVPLQDIGVARRCADLHDVSGDIFEIISERWVVSLEKPSPSLLWGGTPYVVSFRLHSMDFQP